MGKIFFTGDLHFGHANVIAFDNRPFKTVEEMDAELIRRWNSKVGKGDGRKSTKCNTFSPKKFGGSFPT